MASERIGMTRDEAVEYVRQHPNTRCRSCDCALPTNDGDDGLHEVLLEICVTCMLRQNREIREDLGGCCGTCSAPEDLDR